MSSIRITLDENGVIERANKILANVPGGVNKAIVSASKRAGDQGKTKAGNFAAAKYTVSKGTFMSNVSVNLQISDGFTLTFRGGVIPLKRFMARDQRPNGVYASVKRGSGGRLSHAFTGPGAHFYERVGKSRLPIEKKFGPSAAHMMQNDEVIEQMDKVITETFEKRMEVEINRILAGL